MRDPSDPFLPLDIFRKKKHYNTSNYHSHFGKTVKISNIIDFDQNLQTMFFYIMWLFFFFEADFSWVDFFGIFWFLFYFLIHVSNFTKGNVCWNCELTKLAKKLSHAMIKTKNGWREYVHAFCCTANNLENLCPNFDLRRPQSDTCGIL